MPNFAQRVEVAVTALSSNPNKDVDENEFIDASRLVYDGVREIRRAVLMIRVSYLLFITKYIFQIIYLNIFTYFKIKASVYDPEVIF